MKKYMSGLKCSALLLFVVAFVIAVPFLMNVFYGRGCPLIDAWDKSDLMGYYGSIMTAVAAIAGVYFTLDYSKFRQIEYEKQMVRPLLDVEKPINILTKYNILNVSPDEIFVYKKFNNNYYEVGFGVLPNELYWIISRGDSKELIRISNNSFLLRFRVENIGADTATNINLLLNGETLINDLSLKKNESRTIKILIVLDNLQEDGIIKFGDIDIRIVYENIFGNEMYEQSGCIKSFAFNKSTGTYSYLGFKQKNPFGKQTRLDIEPDNESDIESNN